MLQITNLQKAYQKLADFRKGKIDISDQRKLADQIISRLQKGIKHPTLDNAFINNNIQSKTEALAILKGRLNSLKNSHDQNKKTVHDIKKVQTEVKQVQTFPNQWINVTGNGKAKQMNIKMLLKAIQELEEYAY